jgi:hypothetical protein
MTNDFLDEPVTITLNKAVALLLFEWTTGADERDEVLSSDPAVAKSLERLCGELERSLVEPFWPDYSVAIAEARTRVLG